jgi:hypothetical protein
LGQFAGFAVVLSASLSSLIGFAVGLVAAGWAAGRLRSRIWAYGAFFCAVPLVLLAAPPVVNNAANNYLRASLRISSATQKVRKEYVEWQASLGWNIPRERAFATGVGPGNYQINIGPYYGGLPNEEKMPPDSNNLYLVQAVSLGALGLGALLWTIGHFFGMAWVTARSWRDDWLAAALVGALCSWFFVNLFHAMIVRGAGLMLAFFFALAVVAAWEKRNPAPKTSVETDNP